MRTTISSLAACTLALCLGATVAAQRGAAAAPPAPDTPAAAGHVAAARAAAGNDWKEAADFFCSPTPDRANSPMDPLLEPTKIFDNLYVIGRAGTAVFLVQTSEGLVMIDSGYADQLDSVLLPGLAALRLDPASIRYNIVGHGHADHYGGTAYFQGKYGTRVALGARDWDALENPPQRGGAAAGGREGAAAPAGGARAAGAAQPARGPAPAPVAAPKRDIAVTDGQVLTIGDTRFTIVAIPGHTPGSIGVVFDVKDGSTTHTAALFGGTVLIPTRVPDAGLQDYVRSLAHWAEVTKRMNVDVEIQNHPLYDRIAEKIAAVRVGKRGAEHPFVIGRDGYQRFVTVMSECIQAQTARRAAAAATRN